MTQLFRAKFPELQAIEVAVLDNGKPTDERGYVHAGTGHIIDADTFLALYEPAQPVSDSGKRAPVRRGRPPKSAKKTATAKPRKTGGGKSETKPERATLAAAIRAAVANGPKDLRAITDYVQLHGFPEAEERQVGNNAYQLRRSGKLNHFDDGTYSLPEA